MKTAKRTEVERREFCKDVVAASLVTGLAGIRDAVGGNDSGGNDIPFPPIASPSFTFVDLFAGIGGFRLAMQMNGGKCVFSSEWNEPAQKTYFANYGEMPFGDITKEETKGKIPKKFDILCAGFPCQPFSIAGVSKKKSLGRATGFEDKTQGTLFFDVCAVLKRHRPKAFLLENVKNLVSHDKGVMCNAGSVIVDCLRCAV